MSISVVLLTYNRNKNCQLIVSTYEKYNSVDEIIVVSNDGFIPIHNNKTRVVITNNKKSLYERYYIGKSARNEAVFSTDDDHLFSEDSFEILYKSFIEDKSIIHGYFGRSPKFINIYASYYEGYNMSSPIVLCNSCLVHRDYIKAYTVFIERYWMKIVITINKFLNIIWSNGEDIMFSYFVRCQSLKLHKIHKLGYTSLPTFGYAISKTKNKRFVIARTFIMWIGQCYLLVSKLKRIL